MSYGYGGKANPFDQRGDGGYGQQQQSYGQSSGGGGYGNSPQQQYGSPSGGYGGQQPTGGYGGQPQRPTPPASFGQSPRPANNSYGQQGQYDGGVEMSPLAQNAGPIANEDPNYILNECRKIGDQITQLHSQNLDQLRRLVERSVNDSGSEEAQIIRNIKTLSEATMKSFQDLTLQVRTIKGKRDASLPKNAGQINLIDRKLRQALGDYQTWESDYRRKAGEKTARQYRLVNPNADEQELRTIQNMSPDQQANVFQTALMSSRMQGGQSVLRNVSDRRAQFEELERQVNELAQLFQQLDQLIVEQEVQVRQIEQKGEEVVDNLDKGNTEMGQAVQTAIKTRKKKWWCVGIVVAIILIIVIIVALYFTVIKQPAAPAQTTTTNGGTTTTTAKRSLFPEAADIVRRFVVHDTEGRSVGTIPGFIGRTHQVAKRVSLPGGRALAPLTGDLVRGRDVPIF